MKRLVLAPLAVALFAALVPAAALAKGASEATIEGPGLDSPITVKDRGLHSKLGHLAEVTGFYPAVFARIPDPMLQERPEGNLGPRYTITWVMPGPNGETDRIRQDLYPFASKGPVSYVRPGQPFFETDGTHGGWYVASSFLKDDLVGVGLPETPPTGGGSSDFPWTVIGALGAVVIVLLLAVAAALHLRRRPGPATA
jgi:hypothetical protein